MKKLLLGVTTTPAMGQHNATTMEVVQALPMGIATPTFTGQALVLRDYTFRMAISTRIAGMAATLFRRGYAGFRSKLPKYLYSS